MSENAAARVIQRFARRRVLPMKNAEGKFFTGFENKQPISRKYMIAIRGKLYDARNIMQEVKQKYTDNPHSIAMQELFESLSDAEKTAVRRRAGNYGRIFQNANYGVEPQKFIKALKNAGLPVDQIHYDSGTNPLHDAVSRGNVPLVEALLEAGANPNARTRKIGGFPGERLNSTPLHLAMYTRRDLSKRLEIVNLLLRYGAKPNAKDKRGETPLFAAVFKAQDVDVVRALLAAGARPDEYMRIGEIRDFNPAIHKALTNAGFR